jgi:hypothetical protein
MWEEAYFDSVERTASTLWVKLHAPNLPARIDSGLNALDRRVIAVDEEGLPSLREGILQLQSILVVLATVASVKNSYVRESELTW